ncbi:hypothetical protein POSPLADRAFT_1059771 [Postia placenta MAD-698-R-SB12]|uniref:Uncharacterized protein n=1 Tax=Postia placenta MAD-698-R-SB12 TaxID=670580 RepID=A0A1X6MT66_9APHY|nr:hypothetical protein POSPLADRAFT_1059771 [Postia placenta MAD-698-R-SB12]OSX59584.1 hypothetical protein POSPLADRAFT_1059771 [Postia placenta MAD-698-R-SB12]
MPQIYRRHTERTPPPRRPSIVPTDADDSIVISDLVRTGEASRLRRRGAMRLDHGVRPSSAIFPSSSNLSSSRIVYLPPPQTPAPPWVTADPSGDEDYPPPWIARDDGTATNGGGMQLDEMRADEQHEHGFMLFCGGEEQDPVFSVGPSTAFTPSPLPLLPSQSSASTSSSQSPRARRTNGCGALLHMCAFPQRPRGVWVGKEQATDAVVALDSSYFARSAVVKMMRSACGCVREGIGCSACGNTLGTRFLPCQTASGGIFARHPSSTPSTSPQIHPHAPSGPAYWRVQPTPPAPQPASSRASSPPPASTPFYVYTFFADCVSSSPEFSFPAPTPSPAPSSPVPGTPRASAAQPWLSPLADTGDGPPPIPYRWSASPRPLSPIPVSEPLENIRTRSPSPILEHPARLALTNNAASTSGSPPRIAVRVYVESPVVEAGPRTPRDDVEVGRHVRLDADGVPLDEDAEVEEPGSPDKTGSETMVWPGR